VSENIIRTGSNNTTPENPLNKRLKKEDVQPPVVCVHIPVGFSKYIILFA